MATVRCGSRGLLAFLLTCVFALSPAVAFGQAATNTPTPYATNGCYTLSSWLAINGGNDGYQLITLDTSWPLVSGSATTIDLTQMAPGQVTFEDVGGPGSFNVLLRITAGGFTQGNYTSVDTRGLYDQATVYATGSTNSLVRLCFVQATPTPTSTPTNTPTPTRTPTPTNTPTRTPTNTPFATVAVSGPRYCLSSPSLYRNPYFRASASPLPAPRFALIRNASRTIFPVTMFPQYRTPQGTFVSMGLIPIDSERFYRLDTTYNGQTVDRWEFVANEGFALDNCNRPDIPTVTPSPVFNGTPGSATPYATAQTNTATASRTPTITTTSTATATASRTPTATRTPFPTATFPPGCDDPPAEDYAECQLVRLQQTQIALMETMLAPTATWVASTLQPTPTYIPMDVLFEDMCEFEPCYTARVGVREMGVMLETAQASMNVPCSALPWTDGGSTGLFEMGLPQADVAAGFCWFVERYQPVKFLVNAAWYALNALFLVWYFLYTLRRLAGMGGRSWDMAESDSGKTMEVKDFGGVAHARHVNKKK